jgi:hypothetical protein
MPEKPRRRVTIAERSIGWPSMSSLKTNGTASSLQAPRQLGLLGRMEILVRHLAAR